MVEGFDLDVDELKVVADKFNDNLPSPLPAGEIEQIAKNAFQHVHKKDEPRGTLLHGKPIQEPDGQVRTLEDWQEEMAAARRESMLHPGEVFFDGSTTGAGKSFADHAAMRIVKRTITFLPTHEACRELAETLNKQGISAAAFPQLDQESCLAYDEARIAQQAGLDVGIALCPRCPHYQKCLYQTLRKQARNAKHAVATHARAAHSLFAPAINRQMVFIHEDCLNLLRPVLRITSKKTGNSASLPDLENVLLVAKQANRHAKAMQDQAKVEFSAVLCQTIQELIDELRSPLDDGCSRRPSHCPKSQKSKSQWDWMTCSTKQCEARGLI